MTEPELEARLRAVQPAPPSRKMTSAVVEALEVGPPQPHSILRAAILRGREQIRPVAGALRHLGWALGGALLLASLIAAFRPERPPLPVAAAAAGGQSTAPPVLQPIESMRALVRADQEDRIYTDADELSRRVRLLFLERHSWTDAESGALIAVEVPREDIVFLPVAMQ